MAHYASTATDVQAWRAGRGGKPTNWRGGSIMVRLMWQTAADSTDVVAWNKRENLSARRPEKRGGETDWIRCEPDAPGAIRGVEFDRGKTGIATFIPLSADLLADIDKNGALYFVTDPQGLPYAGFADDARLRRHLLTLRAAAVAAGGKHRIFDHLRHSAATDANDCGIQPGDVRHLTTHADETMLRDIYIQQSAAKTIEIQRARGIM